MSGSASNLPVPDMEASDTSNPAARPGFCVLIVEDDEDSRDMLSELVSLLGHRAVRAANAAEALRQVGEAEPALALIDIGLPEIDGCEVARQLRASKAGGAIRLVALTGYSDGATRETAAAAGFDDFVVKPLMPETLEALLRRVTPRSPH